MDEKPKRGQTNNDRDIAAGLRRRVEAAARRDQVDELADAVSEDGAITQPIGRDLTSPVAMLGLDDIDARFAAVWSRIDETKLEFRSGKKDTGDQILQAMGAKPPAEVLSAFGRWLKWLRYVVVAIAIPALTGAYLGIKAVYLKGVEDTESRLRHEQLERDVLELKHLPDRIRDLEEQSRVNVMRIDQLRQRSIFEPRRDPQPTRTSP